MVFKDRLFPNRGEVAAVSQRVLHRGQRDLEGPERAFLLSILCRHPDWDLKRVWNVERIFVSSAPDEYRDFDCFWMEYQDGTTLDFSYRKCVQNLEPTPVTRFLVAARHAISENCEAIREQEYSEGLTCPLSGEPLAFEDAVVEHHPRSFEELMLAFLREKDDPFTFLNELDQGGYETEEVFVETDDSAMMQEIITFKDNDLIDEVADYHAEHAEMQLISRSVYKYNAGFWKARLEKRRQERIRNAPFQGSVPMLQQKG